MRLIFITLMFALNFTFAQLQDQPNIIESVKNSTTTTLAAGDTFTGPAEDLVALGAVQISISLFGQPSTILGDGSNAKGSFIFEFSKDSTNWDTSVPALVRDPGLFIPYSLIMVHRYFRVRYINDGGTHAITILGIDETATSAVNQTAFRLTTYYLRQGTTVLGRTLDQGISGSDPAAVNRSVIMGKDPDGVYRNAGATDVGDLRVADYFIEVARSGYGTEKYPVHKFGSNSAVGNSFEDIWANGGTYPWPTTTETVRIAAGGNVADAAAGAGAQSVVVVGLNGSWNEVRDTLTTNGILASSASSNSYRRVYRAFVLSVGTYGGANTGAITIQNSTSLQTLAVLSAGIGQTQLSQYTVPDGYRAILTRINVNVENDNTATVRMFQRQNADDTSTPFTGKRLVHIIRDVTGDNEINLKSYVIFPAKTDLWLDAQKISGGGDSEVAVDYDLILEQVN